MRGIKRFAVRGMHCAACVALVKKEFEAVDGTVSAAVDLTAGTATVAWEGAEEPADSAYAARIEPFGYGAERSEAGGAAPPERRSPAAERPNFWEAARSWSLSALAAAGVFALYGALQASGLADKASARAGASVVAALLTGVAASVSSCLALVGSLVLALGAAGGRGSPGEAAASPVTRNLLFQGGRIAGFAVLGGLLGLLGGGIALSGRAVSVLTVAVGLVTLILGLSLLGIVPASLASRMPRRFSRVLDALAASPHPAAPTILGAATFFLPCGFTLSMQALALASGGFVPGVLIMGSFALGTSPVLFGVGLAGAWTKRKGVVLARAAGFVVVAFALQSIHSGASLFGFTGNVLDTSAAASGTPSAASGVAGTASAAESSGSVRASEPARPAAGAAEGAPSGAQEGEIQRVSMKVLASAFEPAVIRVKAGVPVEWTIVGENPSGCTNRIVIPGADVSIPVSRGGSQVVRFTVTEPGTIPFSCWMGMVHGKIIVN